MAKITKKLLKMLNIDENTIGDYSGVTKKGESYVLKLNDGSSRTYSPGIFEGDFSLSSVQSVDINKNPVLSQKESINIGKSTKDIWKHVYQDTGETYYTADAEGLTAPLNREIAALNEQQAKAMFKDVNVIHDVIKGELRRIDEIRQMRGKNNEVKQEAKENGVTNPSLPYPQVEAYHYSAATANNSKFIASVEKTNLLIKGELNEAINATKDSYDKGIESLKNQIITIRKDLQKKYNVALKKNPNSDPLSVKDMDELIDEALTSQGLKATVVDDLKKIKEQAERLVKIREEREKTLNNKKKEVAKSEASYIKKSKKSLDKKSNNQDKIGNNFKQGSNIYEEAQKTWGETLKALQIGFGNTGTKTYKPIDSGYETVSQELANEINKEIKNNGIKTPDVNTTIKKRTKFYNSNINDNTIKTFKDPNKQKAYFDFETIGDLSTGGANSPIFAATQLSIRRANGNNEDYIFQLNDAEQKYLNGIVEKIKNDVAITESEERSIKAMAGYSLDSINNKVIAKHKDFQSNVNMKNPAFLEAVTNGIKALSSNADNLTVDRGAVIRSAFDNMINNKELAVGHNIGGFDFEVARYYQSKLDGLEYLDTLNLAKSYLKYGQKGKNGKRLFSYNLGDLADYYGIDRKQLSKDTGLTQHTASYDVALNEAIAEKILEDVDNVINSGNQLKDQSLQFKAGQIATAINGQTRRNPYSYKTDIQGKVIDKKGGGDVLFSKGHDYRFDGVIEKPIGNTVRNFSKYTDIETGDQVFSYMENPLSYIDDAVNIFGGEFRDEQIEGVEDAILSMFMSYNSESNLKAINQGTNLTAKQLSRMNLIKGATGDYGKSAEILEHIKRRIIENTKGSKIFSTNQLGNFLLSSIGKEIGMKKGHKYNVSDLKEAMGIKEGQTVGNMKKSITKFFNTNRDAFKHNNFVNTAIKTLNSDLSLTEEEMLTGTGSSKFHGFANWVFENLSNDFIRKNSIEKDLGNFKDFANENGTPDFNKLNSIIDEKIEFYNKHFIDDSNQISKLYEDSNNEVFRNILTGQDTLNRLKNFSVDTSDIGANLGVYNKTGSSDADKFGRGTLGGIISDFMQKFHDPKNPALKNIGNRIAIAPDGKSLRVGVFDANKAEEFFNGDDILWDKMAGYIDLGLGENNKLSINGMDYMNYLMPYFDQKEKKIKMGTAREFIAQRVLKGMLSEKNVNKILNGKSIQGSINWYRDSILNLASSGGTYKSTDTASFRREATEGYKTGSTREQTAIRSSSMSLNYLLSTLADEVGLKLGSGYEESENLRNLRLYTTALSMGDDVIEAMGFNKSETFSGMGALSDATARRQFKALIKPFIDSKNFALESLKEEGFSEGMSNYIGSRALSPMAFLNSGSARNTTQFFNYLNRSTGDIQQDTDNRQEGYNKGILKNYISTEMGKNLLQDEYYHQNDIYDKFITGYADDVQLEQLINSDEIDKISDDNLRNKVKDALSGFQGSLYESGAILSKSAAKRMNSYRDASTHFKFEELGKLGGDIREKIKKLNIGETLEATHKTFNKDFRLGGVDFKKGDIIQSFTKTINGVTMHYKQRENTELGSKFITEHGNRQTVAAIFDDEVFDWLAQMTGNKGAHILSGKSKLKISNVAELMGGRFDYILNSYIKEQIQGLDPNLSEKEQLKMVQEKLQQTLKSSNLDSRVLSLFNKIFEATDTGYNMIAKNTYGGFKTKIKGTSELKDLFEGNEFDFFADRGENGFIQTLGRALLGANYNPNLTSGGAALSNIYNLDGIVGSIDEEEAEFSSKYKIGMREKEAIERRISYVRHGAQNKDILKKISGYMDDATTPKTISKDEADAWKTSYDRAFQDTIALNNSDKSLPLHQRVTGDIKEDQIFELFLEDNGNLGDRQFALPTFFSTNRGDFKKKMSQEEFLNTTRGRLYNAIIEAGGDPETARLIFHLGDKSTTVGTGGKGQFNGEVTDVSIPLGYFSGKQISSTEGDKALNNLLRTALQSTEEDPDKIAMKSALEDFLIDMRSPYDKNAKIFQDLNSKRVANSMPAHLAGRNTEMDGEYNTIFVNEKSLRGMLEGSSLEDLQALAMGSFQNVDGINDDTWISMTDKEKVMKSIIEQVKLGHSLIGVGHRYPSSSREAMWFSNIKLDEKVKDNNMRIGHGIMRGWNGDFDGDTGYLWTPFANLGKNMSTDIGKDYIKGLFQEAQEVKAFQDDVAELVGIQEERIMQEDTDIANSIPNLEKDKEILNSVTGPVAAVIDILSKNNKGYVGRFSTFATKFRSMSKGMERIKDNGDITDVANATLMSAFFELTEQDAISAKHVASKFLDKSGNNIDYKALFSGLNDYQSLLYNSYNYANSVEGAERKSNDIIKAAQGLGLLKEGTHGEDAVFKGRQVENAIANIQTMIARQKNLKTADGRFNTQADEVFEELEKMGIHGIRKDNKGGTLDSGAITRKGLVNILTQGQMYFGGVEGFVKAINSDEARVLTGHNTSEKISKLLNATGGEAYQKAMEEINKEENGFDDSTSDEGVNNIKTLNVGTITANTIISKGTISENGGNISSSNNSGTVNGSNISGITSSKNDDFYVLSERSDFGNANWIADLNNSIKKNFKKLGVNPLTSNVEAYMSPYDKATNAQGYKVYDAQLTSNHQYMVGNKTFENVLTASQLSSYLDPRKLPKKDPAHIAKMKEILSNIYENGTANVKIGDEIQSVSNVEELLQKTNNTKWIGLAQGMRTTNMGTLIHGIMEKAVNDGTFFDIDKGYFENNSNNEIGKAFQGLLRLGGNEQNIIETTKRNVTAFRSFYQNLGLVDENGVVNGKFNPITEKSNLIQYGNGLTIGGTFDVAFANYLGDFKNENGLNNFAHALQLELLADQARAALGDTLVAGDPEGRKLSQLSNKEIKKMIFQASTGGDVESGIYEYDLTDEQKAFALDTIYLNKMMSDKWNLANASIPNLSNETLTVMNTPNLSATNLTAYYKFLLAQSQNKNDFEGFKKSMEDLQFLQTGAKNIEDNGIEYTYSFFDKNTMKQMSMKVVRDKYGNVIPQDQVPQEVDLGENKQYNQIRSQARQIITDREFLSVDLEKIKNRIKTIDEDLESTTVSDTDKEKLKDERIVQEEMQQRYEAMIAEKNIELMKLQTNNHAAIFEGIESGNNNYLEGMKSFLNNETDPAKQIKKQMAQIDKYRETIALLQKSYYGHQLSGADETVLEKDVQEIERYLALIKQCTAEIQKMKEAGSKETNGYKSIGSRESDAIDSYIEDINRIVDSADATKQPDIYDPEIVKSQQKAYIEDLKRLGDLDLQEAKLNKELNKISLTSEAKNEIKEKILGIKKERENISANRYYDPKTGTIFVAKTKADENGNISFERDEKTGEIQYRKYHLNSNYDGPNSVAGFNMDVNAQMQRNQRDMTDYQRSNSQLGVFGTLKQSLKSAANYMFVTSLGYSIIGTIRGEIQKVIQLTKQLDKTMTDLSIVTGKNRREVTNLMQSYNGLAKSMGLTTAEVSASANEWLRMGYQTNEVNTLIKNSAMLAKLGMIEMGQATEYLTSAIKGYGVAVEDSSSIVDMATSLDMKYAVSAGYILEAMSRTATSAKLAKVEMGDLQSMIAIIGETSQKDASVVGESLKTAFSRYGNVKAGVFSGNSDYTSLSDQYEYETIASELGEDINVNDIEKVLKQVGVTLRNGTEWNSYSDILKEVGQNFQKMSDYEKNAITTAMFGTRQRENGLILLENYNEVMEASKIANESAGTATAKYIKYQDSLEAATNRVTAAFEKFVLGLQGSGTIKDVLSVVSTSLDHIGFTLTAIAGVSIILNLEKVLKLLTLLSTKARTLSFVSLRQGFQGKGMLGAAYNNSVGEIYKSLENSNPEYIAQQKELIKHRGKITGISFEKREGKKLPGIKLNKEHLGLEDLIEEERKGKVVTQEDKDRYLRENKDSIDKELEERENTRLKEVKSRSFAQTTTEEISQAKDDLDQLGKEHNPENLSEQIEKNRKSSLKYQKTYADILNEESEKIKTETDLREKATKNIEHLLKDQNLSDIQKEEMINKEHRRLLNQKYVEENVNKNAKVYINEDKLMQRQIVKANTISTIRGGADMVVGSMLGSDIGQGIAGFLGQDEATWQAVGSMIGLYAAPQLSSAIGTGIASKIGLGPVGGSVISAGFTALMTVVMGAVNIAKKKAEEKAKKLAENVEKSQEKINTYTNVDNKSKMERYDRLSKGVNQYGDNVSLSESEYEEFKNLGNELGTAFDNLVIGFDKEGNALLGVDGSIGGLTQSLDELIEIEKQKLYKSNTETIGGFLGLFAKSPIEEAFKSLKDDLKEMRKSQYVNSVKYSDSIGGAYSNNSQEFDNIDSWNKNVLIAGSGIAGAVVGLSASSTLMAAGAAIGTAIAPVVGTAIGTAIGAAIGVITTAATATGFALSTYNVGKAISVAGNTAMNNQSYKDDDNTPGPLKQKYNEIIKKYEQKQKLNNERKEAKEESDIANEKAENAKERRSKKAEELDKAKEKKDKENGKLITAQENAKNKANEVQDAKKKAEDSKKKAEDSKKREEDSKKKAEDFKKKSEDFKKKVDDYFLQADKLEQEALDYLNKGDFKKAKERQIESNNIRKKGEDTLEKYYKAKKEAKKFEEEAKKIEEEADKNEKEAKKDEKESAKKVKESEKANNELDKAKKRVENANKEVEKKTEELEKAKKKENTATQKAEAANKINDSYKKSWIDENFNEENGEYRDNSGTRYSQEAIDLLYDLYVDDTEKSSGEPTIDVNKNGNTYTAMTQNVDSIIAQEAAEELQKATEEYYKMQVQAFKNETKKRITEFTKEFLPSILGQNEIFGSLSDTVQSFVNSVAQMLNPTQFSNADEYAKAIMDMFVKPLSNPDTEIEIKDENGKTQKVNLLSYLENNLQDVSNKESRGVETTLGENIQKNETLKTAVAGAYGDESEAFKAQAEQMGYTKNVTTDAYGSQIVTWKKGNQSITGKALEEMKNEVYDQMSGNDGTVENLKDDVLKISYEASRGKATDDNGNETDDFKKYKNKKSNESAVNDLTIEEARYISNNAYKYQGQSIDNIVSNVQSERLTSMSTLKDRIMEIVKASGVSQDKFEELIESSAKVEDIMKLFGENPPKGLENYLKLLVEWSDTLGISLGEAYNKAENLGSLNRYGFTTKTVQQITEEANQMREIRDAVASGTVTSEQLTYLYSKDADYAMLSGDALSDKLAKEDAYTVMVAGSIGNTLANSDAFLNEVMTASGVEGTQISAWAKSTGNITGEFGDNIKNYQDMLDFEYYFGNARDDNGNYSANEIKKIANQNEEAKKWLDNHDITGTNGFEEHQFVQAAAIGGRLDLMKEDAKKIFKEKVADQIAMLEDSKIKSVNKAYKDFDKTLDDINRQFKDLAKQEALNKLQKDLENLRMEYQKFDKELSLYDWGFDHLAEADYFGKSDILGDKLTVLTQKNEALAKSMEEVNSKTPKTAEEASALKEEYESLSNAYIENEKAIMEVQEKMESLGATMLESSINQSFEALNKQATRTSNFVALSRLSTYTGGAEGLLNYNLSGTLKSKNEIDKKKSEYEKLLDMQKDFNDKSLELNRTYLELKAKQDQEEIDRQRKELQDQRINALYEFWSQNATVLQDNGFTKESLGIPENIEELYFSHSLIGEDAANEQIKKTRQEAMELLTNQENKKKNKDKSKDKSDSSKTETDTPKMKGTNTVVDTPENVSNHITSTMESGIKSANEEMANDTTKYGVKAPSLDKESWGNDGSKDTGGSVNKGLGLIVKNAYESIIDGLNTYINSDESTKLISPKLNDAGKRGWGANNTTKNSLIDRMKKRINACIEALNTYISSDSGVGKLVAPDVDQKSWEKFGIVIGKYIYDGIQYALGQGIEFDLDSLLSKYNKDHKFKGGTGGPDNGGSQGSIVSKSSSLQTLISQALGKDLLPQLLTSLNPFQNQIGDNIPADLDKVSALGWINPVRAGSLTSQYGNRIHPIYKTKKFHQGIDIGAKGGLPIYAVADGIVEFSGPNGGYGNSIKITHDNGYATSYNHMMSESILKAGDPVKQGEIIGYVGSTGTSTGNHLHFNVWKDGALVNPLNYIPGYAQGTKTHQGGLALVGDEGLFKHSSKAFPEIVILPDGKISLMGTEGPVLANLPKGTEVLNNSDTKKMINISSYADGTDPNVEKKEEEKKEKTEEEYKKGWTEYLDDLLKVDERTVALLTENFNKNNEKIPHLNELSNLEKSIYDPVIRGSYQREIELYGQKDDIDYYKKLSDNAKELRNEAMSNLRLAIEKGASLTELQALENIAEKAQEEFEKNEQAIENSVKSLTEAFTNFAEKINDVYENVKTNLDFSYDNGLIGEKTNDNYYNILRVYSENRVKDLNKNLEDAIKRITDAYIEIGYSTEVAYSKAMESSEIMNIKRDRDQAINDRKQIEIDANQNAIAKYERANSRIEERLGYNSDLLDTQFGEVFETRMKNTKSMIEEDKRFLAENENLSYEQRNEIIDRINTNTKAMITDTSNLINNILNNSKKRVEASVNEREKQLSVGGIRNSEKIYTKNIKDFEKEAEAIVQALADTKSKLREEAILNGLTNEKDIEEYINNHSEIISLNEQYLDTLKKQAEEHKKILDYTVQRLDNEKELLDLSKENEWASISNIQDYYASMDDILDGQIQAQKEYMRSNYLSEDEYNQAKIKLANLQREKFNNDLQRMQDVQSFYNKQYEAMNYIINEYISALNDEKDNIAETYDDEIEKLEKISNTKERIIKLTELQNNLDNAQNEKKRVYRAGVGFVYEQDREAIKKAKDELDNFYEQDQIDNLNKAKEMESKILDDRIEKWQKYLESIEKIYKTAERNENINILENLLGVEGWHGIFNELNTDMEGFIKKYDDGSKIYQGLWDNFLKNYEILSTKIYNKLKESVDVLRSIPKFSTSDVTPDDKKVSDDVKNLNNTNYFDPEMIKKYGSWKDPSRRYIRDFKGVAKSKELQEKYNMDKDAAEYYHEQKWAELFDFYSKNQELVENIVLGKANNTTEYSIPELLDSIYTGYVKLYKNGMLSLEELESRMDVFTLASENIAIENIDLKKKKDSIKSLLNNNVDIQAILNETNPYISGKWIDSTTGLNKDELIATRVYKIWRKFADTDELKVYNSDGSYNHEESLKNLINMIQPSLEENYDINVNGPLGDLIDIIEDYVHQGKLAQNTTIEDVSKAANSWQETEKTLKGFSLLDMSPTGVPQIAEETPMNSNNNVFNVTNFMLTKDDNGYSKIPEAIEQQASINNHAN